MKRKKSIKLFPRKKRHKKKVFKVINFRKLNIIKILSTIEVVGLTYIILMLFFGMNSLNILNKNSDILHSNDTESFSIEEDTHLKGNDILSSEDIESYNASTTTTTTLNQNILDYTEAELSNTKNIISENYTIDEKTGVNYDLFDFKKFTEQSYAISESVNNEPKILIFHTHGSEVYADSKSLEEGVIGLGELLKKELEETYNIPTLHITDRFDLVDGQTQILGAYERMNEYISKIIEENPSIEVVIDLHRDGLPEDVKILTTVNGEDTAPIMFVNGLSSLKKEDGNQALTDLPNQNQQENLGFSFKMRTVGNSLYPNLFKNIYLHAYRYSLHHKGKSLLVEIGAQTNTWAEAKNSIKPLAETMVNVLK
ncbi:MAG: stage II sporulation protein P [Lachnospirales bacterium]